jgi:hypothetical protein
MADSGDLIRKERQEERQQLGDRGKAARVFLSLAISDHAARI